MAVDYNAFIIRKDLDKKQVVIYKSAFDAMNCHFGARCYLKNMCQSSRVRYLNKLVDDFNSSLERLLYSETYKLTEEQRKFYIEKFPKKEYIEKISNPHQQTILSKEYLEEFIISEEDSTYVEDKEVTIDESTFKFLMEAEEYQRNLSFAIENTLYKRGLEIEKDIDELWAEEKSIIINKLEESNIEEDKIIKKAIKKLGDENKIVSIRSVANETNLSKNRIRKYFRNM